jgi:hypothetical protein
LLYDRRLDPAASPLWSQLDGEVVAEPNPGFSSSLTLGVAALATWAEWRDKHPGTRVLAPVPELKKLYKRDPYHSYFGSEILHFPVRPLPPVSSRRFKDRVVVVTVDGHHEIYSLGDLAAATGSDRGAVDLEVFGLPIRITFSVSPGTAIVEPMTDPHRLESVRHSFWFAWYALARIIPDTGGSPVSDGSG